MAEKRNDEILQAAVYFFATKGFSATGIREISNSLGLRSSTLYHYFGSKDALLLTIMRECLGELQKVGAEIDKYSLGPQFKYARLVGAHVAFCAVNPLTSRVTDHEVWQLSEETRNDVFAMRDRYESIFSSIINDAVRGGTFSLPDQTIGRLATLELCNSVAHWFRDDGRLKLLDVQLIFIRLACRLVSWDISNREAKEALASAPAPMRSEPTLSRNDVTR